MNKEMNTDDDSGIISRCRTGDTEAFEELVRKYQRKMFNISYRITGDYNDAAEVVQDAFLSAYRKLKTFRSTSKFSTWLCAITVNLSRNRIKQTHTRQQREIRSLNDPLRTEEGVIMIETASDDPGADRRLEQHEEAKTVRECIDGLEPHLKEAVVLREMQGCSYDEISAILEVATGTVRSRLHRARLAIKECLKRYLEEL